MAIEGLVSDEASKKFLARAALILEADENVAQCDRLHCHDSVEAESEYEENGIRVREWVDEMQYLAVCNERR
jgi:hypothetical protein